MRILSLDCALGLDDEQSVEFRSDASVFDYDLVFWDPANTPETYKKYSEYKGRRSIDASDSAALRRDMSRRKKEFQEFLDLGRMLIVFLPSDVGMYADTAKRTYSGTGKNRHETRIVAPVDLMDVLPSTPRIRSAVGNEIASVNASMSAFFRKTQKAWSYRSVIEPDENVVPLLVVRDTQKTVGGLLRREGSEGLLVLLPDFVPADEVQAECNAALVEWVQLLTNDSDESQPIWAAEFQFGSEVERSSKRVLLEAQLTELSSKLDDLKAAQAQDEQWKQLITGSGTPLERIVEKALTVIGFKIQESVRGRSDIRATYDGSLAVVEVKGVSKSSSEKQAAQLEKWVSAELADGRSAKGILVVNTWRETRLDERAETSFPDQMLPYCEQRGHCLLTGLQLLAMARACVDDADRAPEIADLLMSTVGRMDGWEEVGDVFVLQADVDVNQEEGKAPVGAGA